MKKTFMAAACFVAILAISGCARPRLAPSSETAQSAAVAREQIEGAPSENPTDLDIRVAYCATVLGDETTFRKATIKDGKLTGYAHEFIRAGLEPLEKKDARLRAYLLQPRVSKLQFVKLQAATQDAKRDIVSSAQAMSVCERQCPQPDLSKLRSKDSNAIASFGDSANQWSACYKSCEKSDSATVRLKACDDLDWLPD